MYTTSNQKTSHKPQQLHIDSLRAKFLQKKYEEVWHACLTEAKEWAQDYMQRTPSMKILFSAEIGKGLYYCRAWRLFKQELGIK